MFFLHPTFLVPTCLVVYSLTKCSCLISQEFLKLSRYFVSCKLSKQKVKDVWSNHVTYSEETKHIATHVPFHPTLQQMCCLATTCRWLPVCFHPRSCWQWFCGLSVHHLEACWLPSKDRVNKTKTTSESIRSKIQTKYGLVSQVSPRFRQILSTSDVLP